MKKRRKILFLSKISKSIYQENRANKNKIKGSWIEIFPIVHILQFPIQILHKFPKIKKYNKKKNEKENKNYKKINKTKEKYSTLIKLNNLRNVSEKFENSD